MTAAEVVAGSLGASIGDVLRIAGPLVAHGLVTVAVTMNDAVLLGRSGAEVLALPRRPDRSSWSP